MKSKQETLDLLKSEFRRRGLPLTPQRRMVLEAFYGRTDHPTIDQIYESIKPRNPEMSRTTVYRTLETFVRFNIASKISHPDRAIRYDPNTSQHHHLACVHCDKLVDLQNLDLDDSRIPDSSAKGFQILGYSIYFQGICPACRREKQKGSD